MLLMLTLAAAAAAGACVLRLEEGRALSMEMATGSIIPTTSATAFDAAMSRALNATRPALLCRVVVVDQHRAHNSSHAIVTFATSFAYLTSARRHKGMTLGFWEALVAKARYAEARALDFFLYLGHNVRDNISGLHYQKIRGVQEVMRLGYASVTYADADATPANASLGPEDYLRLGGDLVGSSNVQHVPIVMNGGVWIARNTRSARAILDAWWRHRAGTKDQLALWRALFEAWKIDAGSLFSDYDTAQAKALPWLVDHRPDASPPFECTGRCADVLNHTGCLIEPWAVGRVLLLPVVPHRGLPPLQSEHPHPAWWCHKKCATPTFITKTPTRRRRSRRLRTTQRIPQHRPPAGCVDATLRAFVCPCAKLLGALATTPCASRARVDASCVAEAAQGLNRVATPRAQRKIWRHHQHPPPKKNK